MAKFYKSYLVGNIPFHIFSIISIILIIASWLVPPLSVIDPSVLAAVGELFGFASLWTVIKAIDKGADATIQKGDMTFTINNPDDEE